MTGTLFVVALPIGDLADLSPRAREVLTRVSCIAAEDTRVTRSLLQRAGLPVPKLVSYHDHNERSRAASLCSQLLAGRDVALVSDAGTPLVSDPGYRLVSAAVDAGVRVVAVPGPCAAIAALSASGLPPDRFVVLGFLPRDAGRRTALLERYRYEVATLLLYAAPHRLLAVLEALQEAWGDRRIAVARNLTKATEAWFRGSVAQTREALREEAEAGLLRGEHTLVVEGATEPPPPDDRIEALIDALVGVGLSASDVRDVVARVYERPRRWVYQRALRARQPDSGETS
ncbi:MAG: 16S rRNA (cytidine(1402)-2'-O)-methyltransferase [Myxococcales bacterium]|nr:16S rRNA (cytidine(1402)-2'-O)-methyltransferase [Myxococcales bacterium]